MSKSEYFDFEGNDPVRLFIAIAKDAPVVRAVTYTDPDKRAIITYYERLAHAAKMLNVPFCVEGEIPEQDGYLNIGLFYDRIVNEIEKRKIDLSIQEMQSRLAKEGVSLDENWRQKVQAYIGIIRDVVQKATDLSDFLRQSILDRLNALSAEIDRKQAKIESFSEAMVYLCQALSEGATSLKPAVTVFERIIGALARLKGQRGQLALPPPEDFALVAPQAAPSAQDTNDED